MAWLLLACLATPRLAAIQQNKSLPTLTTARAAHDLASKEASRSYPVHLRAVVTYYDPLIAIGYPMLFVCDASGCVYAALANTTAMNLRAGDLVDLTGTSAPGNFEPIIDQAEAVVIGKAPLPASAPAVSYTDLLSGKEDGQWIQVAGVVRAVDSRGGHAYLSIALSDGTVTAAAIEDPAARYAALIDATVALRGNAAPIWNRQHQLAGFRVWFPGPRALVLQEPPPDPWAIPVQPIGTLLRGSIGERSRHRFRLRGAVTLLWPGRLICIQDETGGLCAKTQQKTPLALGQTADVVGFAMVGDYAPTLVEAVYRAGAAGRPVAPAAINIAEAQRGLHDAQLVAIQGTVVERVYDAKDPTLLLIADGQLFTASLPTEFIPNHAPGIAEGSLLRITGICSLEAEGSAQLSKTDEFPAARSIRLFQRSMADIQVLRKPSWWSAEHTLKVLAAALLFTFAALCVVTLLGRRVRRQTATIRAQLAETRALKDAAEFAAMHDGLTGVLNRRAIFDALHREYHLACRTGAPTGVIMLDLDHFKKVNDTYGHGAGDEVLKEAVRRILDTVRETDLVGRYGGEEFLIVLPDCPTEDLRTCGERIRASICGKPIQAGGLALPVTASFGAVAALFPEHTEEAALAAADAALYQAKSGGRNRVVLRDLDAVEEADTVAAAPADQAFYIC